jgi:hypothetical protein
MKTWRSFAMKEESEAKAPADFSLSREKIAAHTRIGIST